jgi:hypothetical protein
LIPAFTDLLALIDAECAETPGERAHSNCDAEKVVAALTGALCFIADRNGPSSGRLVRAGAT